MLLTTHNLAMHTKIEEMKHLLFLKIELCGMHNTTPQDLCIGKPPHQYVEASPVTLVTKTLERSLGGFSIRSQIFITQLVLDDATVKAAKCSSELEQWAAKQSDQRAMVDIKGRAGVMVALWQQKHVRCAGHLGFSRKRDQIDRSVDLCWTVGKSPEVDKWTRTVAVVETYETVLMEELKRLQCVPQASTVPFYGVMSDDDE